MLGSGMGTGWGWNVGLLGVAALAVGLRLEQLGAVQVLQDGVGPFLAAVRMDGRAHAPGYGFTMVLPYWLASFLPSLWDAQTLIMVAHGITAPLAVYASKLRYNASTAGSIGVGIIVALDPGLMDTARSGAEGYLSSTWIACALAVRGPWAWPIFAVAVANHPLALCLAPILTTPERLTRRSLLPVALALLMILHQVSAWQAPGLTATASSPVDAILAYIEQGIGVAIAVLAGPFIGLFHHRTRGLALRCLGALALLLMAGGSIGYLRDHHLRFLTVPAILCWSAGAAWGVALIAGLISALSPSTTPPDLAMQPGSLSLTTITGNVLRGGGMAPPVAGLWLDGSLAIEPSALVLDSHLRDTLGESPGGTGRVAVIVSGAESTMMALDEPPGAVVTGPTFVVISAQAEEIRPWLTRACSQDVKIDLATDARMAIFGDAWAGPNAEINVCP